MSSHLRFAVEPRDVPEEKAARRLHLTATEFKKKLPALIDRGFPEADPTTGMYDLDAIDAWRRSRHANLFLTTPLQARDARSVVAARLGGMRRG
jgi:hypothetical protein